MLRRVLPALAVLSLVVLSRGAHAEDPDVFAHRGANVTAPPNSLLAFQRARDAGADGVELDVRLSRDGHIVIFHDRKAQLPSGRHVAVSKLTLPQLREVDLGQGQGIPTLDEALDVIGPTMRVNIEVKAESPFTRGLEKKLVSLVRRRGVGHRVIFSSFNPITVRRLSRLAPDIDRGILLTDAPHARLFERIARATAVHPPAAMVTPERVRSWRTRFREINAWTVNDALHIKRLTRLGVTGIITDDPAGARRSLGALRSRFRARVSATAKKLRFK